MTSSAARVFAEHAPQYTALRRRLVPDYDAFYATAVECLYKRWRFAVYAGYAG